MKLQSKVMDDFGTFYLNSYYTEDDILFMCVLNAKIKHERNSFYL